jgi:hypothetical protein
MSLRGAQRRSNLMKSTTYKIRDCFASLAMTTLRAFYETIKVQKSKCEALRPCLPAGRHRAGLPGKVISFYIVPLDPPIPLGRDGARSGQKSFGF